MGLIIRSSTIHAAGCYTTTPIRKGARVVEYTGPLIDKDTADRLYEDRPVTYLFGIGDGAQVIDGHGTAMFINHSCDANCETEEMDGRVWIMALRDIAPGEELCYDYCLYDGDEAEAPCNCGARSCRGSMFSAEELRRRKRVAKKAAAKLPSKKNGRASGRRKSDKERRAKGAPATHKKTALKKEPSSMNRRSSAAGKKRSSPAAKKRSTVAKKERSSAAVRSTRSRKQLKKASTPRSRPGPGR